MVVSGSFSTISPSKSIFKLCSGGLGGGLSLSLWQKVCTDNDFEFKMSIT